MAGYNKVKLIGAKIVMIDLNKKISYLAFCPDHRDKVRGLSCRQCLVESLKKSVDLAIDELDPDMSRLDIIQLRETLIRRREGYGN